MIGYRGVFDRKLVRATQSIKLLSNNLRDESLFKEAIKNIISVVFASIYRFTLIFSLDITDVAWTLADAQTWCVVEVAAGVISACLPTTAPLVKICTRGLVSTAKSLSKSNLTQSESRVLSRTDATTRSISVENSITIGTDVVHAHRASSASFALEDTSPRSSSHLKGKGWTMISAAERDSDSN